MDEKWKKIGHKGNQRQKEKGKKGRAGRPDAVRTSGEKSTFEKYGRKMGKKPA